MGHRGPGRDRGALRRRAGATSTGAALVAVGSRSLERAEAFGATVRHPAAVRQLRGARRRRRRRRGVRRDAALAPRRRHAAVPERGEARALREAVRAERRAGERDGRGCGGATIASSWKRCGRASCPPTRRWATSSPSTDRRAAAGRGRLRLPQPGRSHPPPLRPRAGRRCAARPRRLPGAALLVRARHARRDRRRRVTSATTGVDEQVAAVLHHPGGGLGVVKAAIRTPMACTARIAGTEGWIQLPAFMHCPDHLTVCRREPAST